MTWRKWITLSGILVLGVLGSSEAALAASQSGTVAAETESMDQDGSPAELGETEGKGPLERPSFTDTYPGKLVPFVGMAVAVLIVWIVMAMVQNTDRYRHETIRQYLDKGVEVPHELLVDSGNPQTWKPTSDLRKAMIWLAIGIGIGLTGYIFSGSPKALALGLLFDCIGIGYLIVWKIEPQKRGEGSR